MFFKNFKREKKKYGIIISLVFKHNLQKCIFLIIICRIFKEGTKDGNKWMMNFIKIYFLLKKILYEYIYILYFLLYKISYKFVIGRIGHISAIPILDMLNKSTNKSNKGICVISKFHPDIHL